MLLAADKEGGTLPGLQVSAAALLSSGDVTRTLRLNRSSEHPVISPHRQPWIDQKSAKWSGRLWQDPQTFIPKRGVESCLKN